MLDFTAFAALDTTGLQELRAIVNGTEQAHDDASVQFDWTPTGGPDQRESVVLTLTGSGFGTTIAAPSSGWLISTISAEVNGHTVWTVTGLDAITKYGVPQSQINGAELVGALNNDAAAGLLFTEDAIIKGSAHGNDALVGFDGRELIIAGGGNDRLNGGGQATLVGGPGHDAFVFSHALDGFSIAKIERFNVHHDVIELNSTVFTHIPNFGTLAPAEFHIGHATNAAERILYNPSHGELFYDPHGNHGPSELFAKIDHHLALTASDFLII
jgi:Ca2+-binding RTX toxin-like protein